MDDELQCIVERWEQLELDAKGIRFPAWSHVRSIGKKRAKCLSLRALDSYIDWYDFDQIAWTSARIIRRLEANTQFAEDEIADIQIHCIRIERFIWAAPNGHLRAYLTDLQSWLKAVTAYLQSNQ